MDHYLSPRPITGDDERNTFDCGRDALNTWFRERAWRNQLNDVSRTSVICERPAGRIAGYVSLSSAHVERVYLPKRLQRNMPDPVPVLLLGQLAVDRRDQRRGIAESLLYYAFGTAVRIASEIGCFTMLTHPLDDEVRAFYHKFDFADLTGDPKKVMYARIVDMKKNGF